MYNEHDPLSNDFIAEMDEKGLDTGKHSKLGIEHSDPVANYCASCTNFIHELRTITAEDIIYEADYTEAYRERFKVLTKMVEEFLVNSVQLLLDNFISEEK